MQRDASEPQATNWDRGIVRWGWVILASTLTLFAVWFCVTLWRGSTPGSGEFGDSFGTVSAFGAGVAAILGAFGLKLQISEVHETTLEYQGMLREAAVQNDLQLARSRVTLVSGWWSSRHFPRALVSGALSISDGPETIDMTRDFYHRAVKQVHELVAATNVRLSDDPLEAPTPVEDPVDNRDGFKAKVVAWTTLVLVCLVLGGTWYLATCRPGDPGFGDAFNMAVGLFTLQAVIATLWGLSLQRLQMRTTRVYMRNVQKATLESQLIGLLQLQADAAIILNQMQEFAVNAPLRAPQLHRIEVVERLYQEFNSLLHTARHEIDNATKPTWQRVNDVLLLAPDTTPTD